MARQLGGWTVQRRLGRGGMGTVFHCTNTLVPSIQAAVKTMDPALARSRRSRQRFIREAEVLFTLDHPHIVQVRNLQMDHDPPFLEMAFVPGRTLGSALASGVLTRGAALSVAGQLCSALHHMQHRGVFHRDIKPNNIILSGEHATLVDFGLVTEAREGTLSRPGALFGTLPYVPPEWGGATRPEGAAWDRYALGVVLFECFTGRPAFVQPTEGSFVEQLARVQDDKSARPCLDPGPTTPDAARAVVRQLTARDPTGRDLDLARAADTLSRLRATWSASDADRPVHAASNPDHVPLSSATWAGPATHTDLDPPAAAPTAVPASMYAETGHTLVPDDLPGSPPEVAPPAPPARSRWPRRLAAGVPLGLLSMAAVAFLATRPPPPPPPAAAVPLELVLSPDPPALPVALTLDGEPLEDGRTPLLTAGPHTLRIVLGEGCTSPEDSPHCAFLDESFTIDDQGTGARRRVRLPDIVPRTVTLTAASGDALRARRLDGTWTEPAPATVLADQLPGVRSVVLQAGACPDTVCGTDCPTTCAERSVPVTIPFAESGPVVLVVDLAAPKPAATPPPARPPALVSVGRFARWLARHPEYQQGGARTGSLSARYLRGWSGTTPPAALASGAPISDRTPVEAVAATVARTVCSGRGGLRKADASPRTWSVQGGGTTPTFELRAGPEGTVLLEHTGATLPVRDTDARPLVGFRCQR